MKKNTTTKKPQSRRQKRQQWAKAELERIKEQKQAGTTKNNDGDSELGLAHCIRAILEHPKTPVTLWNAVAHWTTDATNLKNSQGDSLLSRWAEAPETIEACIRWANEANDLEEMAEETQARNGGAK